MCNVRSGFEEYYSTKYPNDDCTLMRNGNYSGWLKQQQWEQWQHQQSKIDELQKRVDDLTQVMEKLLEEMKYPTATFEEVICSGVRELEQALKGDHA